MKTVMVLLNGFGVESKHSYNIYSQELMPNLDSFTKRYIFSQIKTDVNNDRDGYRNLCLEVNEMYNYTLVNDAQRKGLINQSEVFNNLIKEQTERKSKMHIFCLIDRSDKVVEQLKDVVKKINIDKNKQIYLHVVLTSNSILDYDNILKILSKINVELGEYIKIGLVLGLNCISNNIPMTELNFFFRILISEIAEKWQSFSQKLDVCYGMKQIPSLVKTFVVNDGFSIGKDDIFFIWNYDQVDLTNFFNTLKQIKYGEQGNNFLFASLLPIVSNENINYILNYQLATNSLKSNMINLKAKTLIMTEKENINFINYYANGLENINDEHINFVDIGNYLFKPVELINIINQYDHDLMIINYNIEGVKNIEELKLLLHNIDIMLGNIYENSKGSKYCMIISSLYGINKVLPNDKGEFCNVIFNEKVPLIFIDDFITKKDYLVEEGSISNLLPICYMRINNKYQGHSIITKKNALYRLFFK